MKSFLKKAAALSFRTVSVAVYSIMSANSILIPIHFAFSCGTRLCSEVKSQDDDDAGGKYHILGSSRESAARVEMH